MTTGLDPLAAVRDAVAIVCEVEPRTLSRETRFDDLGADSLARVSIADVIEAGLNVGLAAAPGRSLHIDDATLGRMSRLGELADYTASHLNRL